VELRAPLVTSPRLQEALRAIRRIAPFWDCDRAFAPDMARARALVESGAFEAFVGRPLVAA
jgi:histidine ammonia-lyase